MRCGAVTSRLATTAVKHRGCNHAGHDRPFGGTQRAARCSSRVGHRKRIDPADSGFRYQGDDVAGRADPHGRCRDLVRSADGYRLSDRLLARQRRQDEAMRPRTRAWHGNWHMLIVTSIGTDARTRAALRTCMHHKRFGELREGVWMRPDNLDLDLESDVAARVRMLTARDEAPADLAGQLWDLSGGPRPATGCSATWQRPPTCPGDLWWLRRWCATCSPIRCCPLNCCPPTGRAPGYGRRTTTSPLQWRNDAMQLNSWR